MRHRGSRITIIQRLVRLVGTVLLSMKALEKELLVPSEERPPEQTFSHDERDVDEATESRQEEIPESLSALPTGWTQEMDNSSGLPYYYNAETGETSWDRPTASTDTGGVAEASALGEEEDIVAVF